MATHTQDTTSCFPYSPPNFTSPVLYHILALSNLKLHTFVDEWWDLHVQLMSLIRKLFGCCLKTGWSAKRLVLPALNLCLVSFSPLQQLFTYSGIGRGLLADCLFHAVFHFFMHSDHLEEARQAVLDPESWKRLIWLSAEKPPMSPGPHKNPFRWSLRTPLQLINMRVQDA